MDTGEERDSALGRVLTARAISALINAVCVVLAGLLVAHIVLELVGVDPDHKVVAFVDDSAASLSFGLREMFTADGDQIRTLLSDGLAALVWLVVGVILSSLVRRVILPGRDRVHRAW